MAGIITAIIGGAVIGAGATYLASSNAADAQESAADTMTEASIAANNQDWAIYQQSRKDMMPWLTQGTASVNQLGSLMQPGGQLYDTTYPGGKFQFTPEMLKAGIDPAYQWNMEQGVNALAARSAAAGNYGSGNLGTALIDYGQNVASNEYGKAYGRAAGEYENQYNQWLNGQNTLYNRLAGISGTGQVQSTALGSLGANTAAMTGANMLTGASAQGAGQVGAANTWGNAASNIGNQIQSGVGMYMNNQNQLALMNMMNRNQYSGGGYPINYGTGSGGGWGWGGGWEGGYP